MAEGDPDPRQDEDRGNGHSPFGVLAGIAALLSVGALRSCDDVARVASHAADVADNIGSQSSRVRAAGGPIKSLVDETGQPLSGSATDNGTLARHAGSEAADLEKYTADVGRQAAELANASGTDGAVSGRLFETRNFPPRLQLVYAAPRDRNEFRRIFDRTATASELAMVAKATRRISGIPQSRSMGRAHDVLGVIDNEQDAVVVIIGHNDSGKLRLADGSEIEIAVMARHCEKAGKLCVVLSCNSNRFLADTGPTRGVDDALTYEEAGRIGSEISAVFDKLAADGGAMLRQENFVRANQVDALVKLSLERGVARNRSIGKMRQSGKLVSFSAGGGLIVYGRGIREPND